MPGAFVFILFLIEIHVPVCRVKILIIRRVLRRLIWACAVCPSPFFTGRYAQVGHEGTYLTFMSRLSNVREILQFHYCNVTLYTKKETVPQGQNRAVCFVTTAHFFIFHFKMFRVGPKT